MSGQSTKPPSGTRDFLPDQLSFRQDILNKVAQQFSLWGYQPISTPVFEKIETLTGKYGDEGEKLIFKILKRGDKEASGEADMALRYDLTVPLMRFYANHQNELPKVFKKFQIAPVWRADRPGQGRYREFYQCDIDCIGSSHISVDIEIISLLVSTLNMLGLKDFTVKINSRKMVQALLKAYDIKKEFHQKICILLDKIDKIGKEKAAIEIESLIDHCQFTADLISENPNDIFLEKVKSIELGQEGFQDVEKIISGLNSQDLQAHIDLDLLLIRGLDYYTGAIFEIFAEGSKGAIASGGRYDELSGIFLKQPVPAFGGSLGIERIMLLLEEKMAKSELSVDVYVVAWDEESYGNLSMIANKLRAEGISVDCDISGQKLKHQYKIASQKNAKFVMIQGPDEKERGEIALKNLETGDQEKLSQKNILAYLMDKLL